MMRAMKSHAATIGHWSSLHVYLLLHLLKCLEDRYMAIFFLGLLYRYDPG
ncbi:hypothetical protein DAI22_06g267703 [Oryza sativa Japonica Group]|nr:hypothetical protein DAI22_06g267703 [Oryza sativa Japonica Group]